MGPRVVRRTPNIVLANTTAEPAVELDGDELLDAYRELVTAQARVIGLLESARNPREIHRGSRGSDREAREEVHTEEEEEVLLSSWVPRATSARPRADVADWTDDELDETLEPLHHAVQDAGLKEMNNRACLASALHAKPLTEIRGAVARLVHDAKRRDTNVRSPFGVLAAWAKSGTLPQAPQMAPVTVKPAVEEPPQVPQELRAGVAALDDGQLADLDLYVDCAIGTSSIRRPAAMQAALRLEHFEQWDTARTAQGHDVHNERTDRGAL